MAKQITSGNKLATAINPPAINICHAKDDKIAKSKCPAVILPASRSPNVRAVAT